MTMLSLAELARPTWGRAAGLVAAVPGLLVMILGLGLDPGAVVLFAVGAAWTWVVLHNWSARRRRQDAPGGETPAP
jgi:hypothetical protein